MYEVWAPYMRPTHSTEVGLFKKSQFGEPVNSCDGEDGLITNDRNRNLHDLSKIIVISTSLNNYAYFIVALYYQTF